MPFFPKGRRGVLFCAPIWNITRKRRRGGPLRPPVPRCGTFPHSSRRGGACPSRRVSEFFRSTLGWRRAGSSRPTDVMVHEGRAALRGRPSPVVGRFPVHPVGFWNSLVRRAPTRTLCHGWSEPGAAVKLYQPKFCAAPGPSGPERIIPGTVFCAPEILRKGIGVSPVNGGPGENELEPEGTCFRRRCESPPAILWFLSHRRERNSPPGRRNSPPQRSGSAGRLDAARRRGAYAPKGKRSRPFTPDPAVPGLPKPAWTAPHFCSACL